MAFRAHPNSPFLFKQIGNERREIWEKERKDERKTGKMGGGQEGRQGRKLEGEHDFFDFF